MVLRSSSSCEATADGHEYCEGTAAGAVAKRRQRMFYASVAAYAATTWADAIRCNRRHRRYEQVRGSDAGNAERTVSTIIRSRYAL
jgi:hypothetical protein